MNKFVIFITLILAASISSAPSPLRSLPALKHEHIHDEFGQYALRYVTAEGTIVTENGKLVAKKDGTGHVMEVEGEVTYVGDDGKTYVTKYTAGVDGVKMQGDHLPIAPTVAPVDSEPVALVDSETVAPVVSQAVVPVVPVSKVVSAGSSVTPNVAPVIPEAPSVPPMTTAAA